MVVKNSKEMTAHKCEVPSELPLPQVEPRAVKSLSYHTSYATKRRRSEDDGSADRWRDRVRLLMALAVVASTLLVLLFAVQVNLLSRRVGLHRYIDDGGSSSPAPERSPLPVEGCSVQLVESIPIGLSFNSSAVRHMSTYHAWKRLLALAASSVDVAAYYWTLLGVDVVPDISDAQGEDIYYSLNSTGLEDNITLRIVENGENGNLATNETAQLASSGAAEVRRLNFTALVGAGILHTKLWVVDGWHFYVGSANMDYRSLTQVKELGALVTNCSTLGDDMRKIFQVYWLVGDTGKIPDQWPQELHTEINRDNSLPVKLPNETALIYLSSSPPELCPPGRTADGDAIVHTIEEARRFVYIAVMDYFPMLIYGQFTFWPVIDDALRRAAVDRGVEVRLLASYWNHTDESMLHGLRSLQALNATRRHVTITVRMFEVPPYSGREIPFSRVNHNKYMVTDQVAYIGTSNWSGDYFVNTGGVGLVVNSTRPAAPDSLRAQLEAVFLRDWQSEHAHPLDQYH